MSTNSVQSTTSLSDLATALVSRFDANKDGTLTTDEFTQFLSQMLGSAGNAVSAFTKTASSTSTGLKGGSTAPMLTGFDAGKLADTTHTSMKYKFGRVAQTYSLQSVTDKTSAETLLGSMTSDLSAAGLDVLEVKGDSIKVKDDAGQEAWIDVIRGSKSGSPAWQWLDSRF
jgi:hypothetical protein